MQTLVDTTKEPLRHAALQDNYRQIMSQKRSIFY